MTKEEQNKIVESVVEAMQETSEIEVNSIMSMVITLLIKLESISNKDHRIIFLNELGKEFNEKVKSN